MTPRYGEEFNGRRLYIRRGFDGNGRFGQAERYLALLSTLIVVALEAHVPLAGIEVRGPKPTGGADDLR